jgi:hypothetical protein
MTTYIVSYKVYSERAGKFHGHPYAWRGHNGAFKVRTRVPNDKSSLHHFLLNMLHSVGLQEATMKIIRPQAKGESAGFKLVFYGHISPEAIEIDRFNERLSGHEHKAIPGQGWVRQLYYQAERHGFSRTRFKGTGGRFGSKKS